MAEDILRSVEEALAAENGPRIVHDFLEKLAREMEKMSGEECKLRAELMKGLSEILAIDVPEAVLTVEGAETLAERLKAAGMKGAVADNTPADAENLWSRLAPGLFDLRKRLKATDNLISDIVDRMYGIQRISG